MQKNKCFIDYKPEILTWIAWVTDGSSIFNRDNIRTFNDLNALLDWVASKGVQTRDITAHI